MNDASTASGNGARRPKARGAAGLWRAEGRGGMGGSGGTGGDVGERAQRRSPAPQPDAPEQPQKKDAIGQGVEEGLKALKGLFGR